LFFDFLEVFLTWLKVLWQIINILYLFFRYSQGITKNPSYREVSTSRTKHAEVVRIIYFPEILSTEKILEIFWENHDSTTPNQQRLHPFFFTLFLFMNIFLKKKKNESVVILKVQRSKVHQKRSGLGAKKVNKKFDNHTEKWYIGILQSFWIKRLFLTF
jgi:hypothetical protein